MNVSIRRLYPFIWGIALIILLTHGLHVVAGIVKAAFVLGSIAFVLINVCGLSFVKNAFKQDIKKVVLTEVALVYLACVTFTASLLVCMPAIMAGDMTFLEPKYWIINMNLVLGMFTFLRFIFQLFKKDVLSD
ncbi:MAG: hypothetical protein CMF61_08010 [Magnetococcales bacterium]|nr:hypothetical protein [Magnetococcales bacterium]PPR17712.1 MAG: hypothetical protein CFH43_00658 [Pseudomonadota bacterium]